MIYVLVIDDRYWRLNEDGTLTEISPTELDALGNNATLVHQDTSILASTNTSSTSSAASPTTIEARVNLVGPERIPESGFDTLESTLGNPAQNNNTFVPPKVVPPLNANADINVNIEDNGDGFINSFEVATVYVFGDTLLLFNNQVVDLTITDSLGASLHFQTTVFENFYDVNNLDLTSLAQGEITATAVVTDFYGNSISATDTSVIDTLAIINDDVTLNGGNLLNAVEVAAVSINGTSAEIDGGQTLSLLLQDALGNTIEDATTLAPDGSYQFLNLDLSALVDGGVTGTLTAQDIPGNIALHEFQFTIDTTASISVNFDGEPAYSTDEITAVSVSGTTNDIESGQTIAIILSDGAQTLNTTATVNPDGSWQSDAVDLSGFNDGDITAEVSVMDIAGNPATAQTTAVKDTLATIDINTDNAILDIDAIRAGENVTIEGTTTEVEPGQSVNLVFTDSVGNQQTFTALVLADGSWNQTVAITDLEGLTSWHLEASVQDIAGNTASDEPPSLDLPTEVRLSEQALVEFPDGYSDTSNVAITGYDSLAFSATQSALEQITSNDIALSVTVAPDGQSLVASSGANPVIEAQINNNATVTVTLKAPVDQGFFTDSLYSSLLLMATQQDSDATSETVQAEIPLILRDSGPFTEDDTAQAIEQIPTNGNLFDNDNLQEGPLQVIQITVEGMAYTVTLKQPASIDTSKGELTVYSDGSWAFLAHRNLDNSIEQTLEFTYFALDSDGDFDQSDMVITIEDGAAGVFPSGTRSILESDYNDNTAGSIDFIIEAGSDNLDPASVVFADSMPDTLAALNYTSSGVALAYSLTNGGSTLVASAGGDTVFEINVSAIDDGNGNLITTASIVQTLPLDHLTTDTLLFPLNALATDTDGTQTATSSTLLALDGNLPGTQADGIALSENDLSTLAQATADLSITLGSDQVAEIRFSDDQPDYLTSAGASLSYQVSSDGLTLTAFTESPLDPIFEVVLSQTPNADTDTAMSYTFTLLNALDQLDVNGNKLDPLPFNLNYQVTDWDGDTTHASMPILIEDASAASGNGINITLTETPVSLDNAGVSSSASSDFSIDASQDIVSQARFDLEDGAPVLTSDNQVITQNGTPLIWRELNAYTWQAQTESGVGVIEIAIPATINILAGTTDSIPLTATVLSQLDHIDNNTPVDALTLPVSIIFIDTDLTETPLQANITVLDGRDPIAISAETLSVNEADTFTQQATDSGLANGVAGSDVFVDLGVTLVSTITSGTQAIELASVSDENSWWIATAAGEEVFRVRITLNGETEFELSKAIDHPAGDDQNTLPIEFAIHMIDVDLDESNAVTLTVDVIDDVPIDQDYTVKLTEGGNRSINVLDNHAGGVDGAQLTRIEYDGTEYTFTSNPIVITLMENGQLYGSATIHQNGQIQIATEASLNASFEDNLLFDVTDSDLDTETNQLTLNVRDEEASIEISPLETNEDTPLSLTLNASPGDLDNNESITQIAFNLAGLQGGILTLDGIALNTDTNGNPILSGNQLLTNPTDGSVQPNGDLVFTPALNTSNPTHQVQFQVEVTVNSDSGVRLHDDEFDVSVLPIVDSPSWSNTSVFEYDMVEDGPSPDFQINALLEDTDGSESLTYRVNNIESGLTLFSGNQILQDGVTLSGSELNNLVAEADANLAGQLQFDLTAIAEETSTGQQAEIQQTIVLNVAPVADQPTLSSSSVFMLEDQLVALGDFIDGSLQDTDGSESLSYQLTLPDGWVISDSLGNETGLVSPGIYRITDQQVNDDLVFLKPLEDISSHSDTFSLTVQSVAIETSVDGIDPITVEALSNPRTVDVVVKGVVDQPAITPDAIWSFDGTVISGSFNEDELIALDFSTGTEDDDGSESFDFVIRGIPDGVELVDSNGNPQTLNVLGSFNGSPQYSVSATELANLYVKPQTDFSGSIVFDLIQTNTEPDGDSNSFDLQVNLTIVPVVDTQSGISSNSVGGEDRSIPLQFNPPLADQDGSETLTNITVLSLPAGVVLLLDESPISVPAEGLNLAQLASDLGITFQQLIDSTRLAVQAPEDSDADFNLPVLFEITDTAPSQSSIDTVSGNLQVQVQAIVDDQVNDGITRIETASSTLISTDGSALSLDGQAEFIEEDIDGSEYLDYVSIQVPENSGWFISHPNGAVHDGQGNWLIPANNLTSDTTVDALINLLLGATIVSDHVANTSILVSARVLDHNNDADIISNTLEVDFQVAGPSGSAGNIGTIQLSTLDGEEGTTLDGTSHLNSNPTNDGNDQISYRIDAADLPYGGSVNGADVITQYANDGTTVLSWVFTNASLNNLSVSGMDEDFAGASSIPVYKVATDPSGDTQISIENLTFEIDPVVDDIGQLASISVLEDTPTPLNLDLNSLLGDQDSLPGEGVESIQSVRFILDDGFLEDPNGLLINNGDGSFTLNDPSQIHEILYRPPLHVSGEASADIELELTVQDQTSGLPVDGENPDIQVLSTNLSIDIIAQTDSVLIIAPDQAGNEDTDIALQGLQITDLDTDGSETLSLQLLGVPAGAVLLWNNNGTLQQLTNNGSDGAGGFSWSFDADQLDDLVLRPPRDFAGDITLTLQATSMELSTQEIVTNAKTVNLFVNPVADHGEFYQTPEDITAREGDTINIGVYAKTKEALNPNETIIVTIVAKSSSDLSASQGLVAIRTPDNRITLFNSVGFTSVASVVTTLADLESLNLITNDNAFGTLDIDIIVGSQDSAIVNGQLVTDSSTPAQSQTQSITIDITPLPDPPVITVPYNQITAAGSNVPLLLQAEAINPAPGETSVVIVRGVPEHINLSHGTLAGSNWEVSIDDIAQLALQNAVAGETYSLSLEPQSELGSDSVSGDIHSIDISMAPTLTGDNSLNAQDDVSGLLIGADGSDTLTAANATDTFLFRLEDLGTEASPANDSIIGFNPDQDQIHLSDIAQDLNSGAELNTIIELNENAGTTTLLIDVGNGIEQTIALQGITRDQLYGGSGWSNDEDILQRMLEDNLLLTGQSG